MGAQAIISSNQAQSAALLREKILRLEAEILAMRGCEVEIKTTHYFAPGLYMREIFIPKGTILTGKIQKTEYLNILSQGDISVMTEQGMKRTKAPAVIRSHPGLKRAGFAHEDTVWLTVHQNPTNERDIEKLELMLFADNFDEAPAVMKRDTEAPVVTYQGSEKTREQIYKKSARTFADVLTAVGTTLNQVQVESENPADQVPFSGLTWVTIQDSSVHGKGVFAGKRFEKGETIAPARIGGKRTPAGRYGNHGADPNTEMVMRENGDVDLVALTEIEPGTEILSDYYFNVMNTRSVKCQE